jgi:hypothetical protein
MTHGNHLSDNSPQSSIYRVMLLAVRMLKASKITRGGINMRSITGLNCWLEDKLHKASRARSAFVSILDCATVSGHLILCCYFSSFFRSYTILRLDFSFFLDEHRKNRTKMHEKAPCQELGNGSMWSRLIELLASCIILSP